MHTTWRREEGGREEWRKMILVHVFGIVRSAVMRRRIRRRRRNRLPIVETFTRISVYSTEGEKKEEEGHGGECNNN